MNRSSLLALPLYFISLTAFADPAPDSPVKRSDIPALVKQVLMDNPEMVMEALKKLHDQQMAETNKTAKESIGKNKSELFGTASPSAGPKDADVILAEFFDYHCGYCKRQLPVITQLLNEDKKVRVVFKDFPILSEDSTMAAKAALGVNAIAPEKYFAYHTALMQSNGKFDEKMLMDTADKLGIDSKKLKAEMARPEIAAMLEKNHALADSLGIRGTPAIVIGSEMVPGAMSFDDLKKLVADARAGKKSPAKS